ncbi:hypothetical protein [Flavobacterium sp. K5-23]|uniref:hypothetical protein n=1 Tax=Flavobacterium sp. K5-23 TaxID=2746225 RepID=UPI002010807D|nr:hypothetical protein [Flavobacterium sp. K5-23]UQD54863.1 hypothetical protein FLAK523_00060 [Flavobacterium sp. K5-23]
MKSFLIWLLVLGLTTTSYSQIKTDTNPPKEGPMSIENLPGVVIKSAGKDFSVYVPDRNTDPSVRNLEDTFIAYDLGKDYEGYETYLVVMEIEKGSLAATYNENGKLMSVVENYKNVKLPSQVIYSVYKKYPGWEIVNDKYLYTQEDGDVIKKQYNLKIKNGKETRKLVVHANGDILKG